MEHLALYEKRRLSLQSERDAAKTQAERNQLGQFATPTALAMEMLAYAKHLLSPRATIRFLDPGFGTGSFFSALMHAFPAAQIEAAVGFEVDAHYGKPALELWADTPLDLRLEDFTYAEPPMVETGRFNLVICNPPYVRHHHITNGEKTRLQDATEQACGVRVAGLAGLYCYFLGLAHKWMAEGGVAGWLIPSEFMDVNYGKAVKRYLLDQVTLLRIHRFDPQDVQFEDALVSSAIVWFRKEKPPMDHTVNFTYGGTLLQPVTSRMVTARALRRESKWTRFPMSPTREVFTGVTLGDLFTIKRGLATGANKFFILPRDEILKRGLPVELFRPILPSPRYLPCNEILADDHGNPVLEHQLFLLDCRIPEEVVKVRYPPLWQYLQTGKPDVASRYLCRKRSPWYSQEDRPSSPFVCTYMGRASSGRRKPFRFILNHSKATATNVYLMLYPVPELEKRLECNPELLVAIWQALNRISFDVLKAEGRVYGGGLYKIEPRELANTPADGVLTVLSGDIIENDQRKPQ